MVESVSDPVGSGIIRSLEDSGEDLLTAAVDPDQYDRQVHLFHQVVGFKRLGLIYADSEAGRAYAALAVVQKVADEEKFVVVEDTGVLEDPPDASQIPLAEEAYVKALERLVAQKVDAVYLAIQAGLTLKNMPRIRAITEAAKIPTFAMEGSQYVRRGALLGESSNVLTIEGLAGARKLTRILAGTTPRALPQVTAHLSHVAVNAATAKAIGFEVPVDVMIHADEVYNVVE